MFKNFKLGSKITFGFTSLIVITLCLGGMAVWNMHRVATLATTLAEEYVPQVAGVNEVERSSLHALEEMRGYTLTGDEKCLAEGREHLGEMNQYLEECRKLADESPDLAKLREAVPAIQAQLAEYERLTAETVAGHEAIDANREKLDTAMDRFMQQAGELLAHEYKSMKAGLDDEGASVGSPGPASAQVASSHAPPASHHVEAASGHASAASNHPAAASSHTPAADVAPVTPPPCPAAAASLQNLQEGNARYAQETRESPHLDAARRQETLTGGQHPFVSILSCSDSRVPVEAIFDQGIGDVFSIRVAGNVCNTDELGSIEYGVDHLETPLLVVLGHSACGAVTAAAKGAEIHGSTAALIDAIKPVVAEVKSSQPAAAGDQLVSACIQANVWKAIQDLFTHSPAVHARAKEGKVQVVGAIYHLDEGTVEWLGPHPRQGALLAASPQGSAHGQAPAAHQDSGHGQAPAVPPESGHGQVAAAHEASDHVQTAQETASGNQMLERVEKIEIASEIINLGNEVHVACLQSQALRDPKFMKEAEHNFPKIAEKLKALRAITHQEVNLKQIDQIGAAAKEYQAEIDELLGNWVAMQETDRKQGEAAEAILAQAQSTTQAGIDQAEQVGRQAESSLSAATTIMLVGLGVAAALGIVLAVFITRSITGPLHRIVSGLDEGADQVNDAAGQVSSASQQLAEGASEQASSLEETSSALEEMAAMTRTNASNAKEANGLAGQARSAAQNGNQIMVKLNSAMTSINESSDKISKIIKVIEEIAFQTNLLALNAAVEAARAGEHGKGFAVVADEVRNLAQRAAQAAKETTGLIEEAVTNAREGSSVATEVGKALGQIVTDASKVSDLINGIAQASDEQAQGVDQVNTAVAQMDKVTQQNASGAEESASASEELAAQAQAVKGIINELNAMIGGSRQGGGAIAHSAGPDRKTARLNRGPSVSRPVPVGAGAGRGAARPRAAARTKASAEPKPAGGKDFLAMDDHGGVTDF